jgi:hypothetical protein
MERAVLLLVALLLLCTNAQHESRLAFQIEARGKECFRLEVRTVFALSSSC